MKMFRETFLTVAFLACALTQSAAQQKMKLGDNAALRYYAAFSEMQDSFITDRQAKALNAILDGTAPYDDLTYKDLIEKNRLAIEAMARGTKLKNCDWGLDYLLGDQTPVEYVRMALQLGRLNVLYSFHLMITGDKDGAVSTLAAGMRFSQDVANGGSLFATLTADNLLVTHFRAAAFALHSEISPAQRAALQRAVAQLGPEALDWERAIRLEMTVLNRPDWQMSIPLGKLTEAYVTALKDASTLPQLEQLLATVPLPLRGVIPMPKQILEEKQDFSEKLRQIRSLLQ